MSITSQELRDGKTSQQSTEEAEDMFLPKEHINWLLSRGATVIKTTMTASDKTIITEVNFGYSPRPASPEKKVDLISDIITVDDKYSCPFFSNGNCATNKDIRTNIDCEHIGSDSLPYRCPLRHGKVIVKFSQRMATKFP
jgi:hypothetical protein